MYLRILKQLTIFPYIKLSVEVGTSILGFLLKILQGEATKLLPRHAEPVGDSLRGTELVPVPHDPFVYFLIRPFCWIFNR